MKRLLLFCLCLLVFLPAAAQRRQSTTVNVDMVLLDQKRTSTGSQTHDLMEFKVKLTNKGENSLVYTNNRFLLTDADQKTYPVNRLRYPDRNTLNPGESAVVERIFIDIPKKSKPAKLSFLSGRNAAQTIDL